MFSNPLSAIEPNFGIFDIKCVTALIKPNGHEVGMTFRKLTKVLFSAPLPSK